MQLSTGQVGFTPSTFIVSRKLDIAVDLELDGYAPAHVVSKSSLSGGGAASFVGNAVIGGVVGGALDVGTGATLSHHPNPLLVVLVAMPKKNP